MSTKTNLLTEADLAARKSTMNADALAILATAQRLYDLMEDFTETHENTAHGNPWSEHLIADIEGGMWAVNVIIGAVDGLVFHTAESRAAELAREAARDAKDAAEAGDETESDEPAIVVNG